MKEQDERIERLLECYFDARTTEAEERELRDYFRYVDEIPASLRYARTMFGGLDALAEERYPGEGSVQTGPAVRPAERMRRYETRSAAGRGARGGRKLPPLWGVAAAAAVFFLRGSKDNAATLPAAEPVTTEAADAATPQTPAPADSAAAAQTPAPAVTPQPAQTPAPAAAVATDTQVVLRNAAANGTITVDGKAVDFAYVGNDAVIPRSSLSDVCQVRIVADNGNGGYQTAAVWYNKDYGNELTFGADYGAYTDCDATGLAKPGDKVVDVLTWAFYRSFQEAINEGNSSLLR